MTCACIVHAVLDSWLPYGIGYGIRDTEYVVPYLRQGMASAVSACSLTNAKALGDHRTCVLRLLRAHEAVPGALGGAVCGRRKPPSPAPLLSQCFRGAFAVLSHLTPEYGVPYLSANGSRPMVEKHAQASRRLCTIPPSSFPPWAE